MPKNLATNIRSDSHVDNLDPERIVLSSGIPPVAALRFLPLLWNGLSQCVTNIATSTTTHVYKTHTQNFPS